MPDVPRWVPKAAVLALHEEQRLEHGGPPGLRDAGLLDSALDRPKNLFAYGSPDLAAMAAAYAFGLVKNHAFIDGNKRASFFTTEVFLDLNGFELAADDASCVITWLALADGSLDEAGIAEWLREHMQRIQSEEAGARRTYPMEASDASRITALVRSDELVALVSIESGGKAAAAGLFDAAALEEAIKLLADARAMLKPQVPPNLEKFDTIKAQIQYRWHVEPNVVEGKHILAFATLGYGWIGLAMSPEDAQALAKRLQQTLSNG